VIRIVMSCDNNPLYKESVKPVFDSYRYMFKEDLLITFLYLTNNKNDGEQFIKEFGEYGDIRYALQSPNVPVRSQGMMARYYIASLCGDDHCIINDIDLMPLSKEYIDRHIISSFNKDRLLAVGAEVYNNGLFPISHLSGTGDMFQKLTGNYNLSFKEWIEYINTIPTVLHPRERVSHQNFCDEHLMRVLIMRNNIPTKHIQRGFVYKEQAVDRAWWWTKHWNNLDNMIESHLPRPYSQHKDKIDELLAFVKRKYSKADE
jgi:hypothetical protein